ncbi:AraC family transcriptional regulator [Roseiconus nitratireducens]|uniref:AraC family transcriptional regulator n=1 Tax=Roseiconus nitratireducens TaxID=2605748 RepID=A0A5M6DDJ6_9BACT|nr:AraC family transcriptional regulator [Roseiconus nitratireducens]KAA5544352.1 AraC family transcriptional regulator [Roseiconus nitratireducens]
MLHSVFTEFEAYAEVIQNASMDMRLPSLRTPRWEFMHASVGRIHVQYALEGGGNIAEGCTFRDGWAFFQQSAHGTDGLANGRPLATDEVFVIPPGADFCLACKPKHEWASVFIPASDLFQPTDPSRRTDFPLLDELTGGQESALPTRPFTVKPSNGLAHTFKSLVCGFLSSARLEPSILFPSAASLAFREELISTIRRILQSPRSPHCKHFDRWHEQTTSAIQLAATRPANALSLPTLARLIRVPERTLRTAFQRQYGISPVEFLRIDRLHEARRILRTGCPDQTSVTKVAIALGFWDLGRFAIRYRRLFGEKPSVTLRTAVRR